MTQGNFEPSETIEDFLKTIHDWYDNDYMDFKTMFDATINCLQPPPVFSDSKVYYNWEHSTIDDLCKFFLEWYKWEPKVEDGLNYIEKFSWLNYRNDAGDEVRHH